ncbi:squalene/phytoene synthase family protein [Algirhabdus cladophorae]|uniref:squalene/phytoene synthase family protein n=1 Tax=Algirhabdus cladophorae TaxID=3377108 RepID=UPI003B846874
MSIQACAELVERADPDRFRATMAAPVAARDVLFPIFAFNVEVSRAPWVTQEPMIAEMRLQWWRDALEEIQQNGVPRKHEVTTPLAGVLSGAMAAVLDANVAARRWDIYKDAFEDAAHFDEYLGATTGGLLWVAAWALGAKDEASVRRYAKGIAIANWLVAVPALEAAGRIPLLDGRADAVRDLAKTGLDAMASVSRDDIPAVAHPALWSGWKAKAILRQVIKTPARVADGALGVSEFGANLGLLRRSVLGGL